MLTSLDRVGRRSSNLALYFGLAPVREQKFEQFEMPRRERGQRSPFEDFVEALQRVLAARARCRVRCPFPPTPRTSRKLRPEARRKPRPYVWSLPLVSRLRVVVGGRGVLAPASDHCSSFPRSPRGPAGSVGAGAVTKYIGAGQSGRQQFRRQEGSSSPHSVQRQLQSYSTRPQREQ